jgi:predicted PurR-regulated permease PerM
MTMQLTEQPVLEPGISPPVSPKWGPTMKLIVGLTFVSIVVGLVVYFRGLIGPIILAFVLSYLLHPLAERFSSLTRLSWKSSVNIIYLVLLVLLASSITVAGFAVVQQIQNLILVVDRFFNNLPVIVADLSTRTYIFGPFEFALAQLELGGATERFLAYLQPLLGRMGSLVSSAASSAAATLGWILFVLIISYFLLADASRVPEKLPYIQMPGYDEDLRRLGIELKRSWNAFLRGQLILITFVLISYTILMTVLGVRYAIAIAILAGLSRFVPYVGTATAWTVTALVAFFQPFNYFGLDPWQYTLLVIGSAVILDQIFDNLISPRLFGQTLGIHPAAVLIAAILSANLIGLLGLVLAAPAVATFKLVGRYIFRKMVDLDPWPVEDEIVQQNGVSLQARAFKWLQSILHTLRHRHTG